MLGSDTDHSKTDPPCLLIIFCTNNFNKKINMMSTTLVIFNSSNEEYLYLYIAFMHFKIEIQYGHYGLFVQGLISFVREVLF